MFAFSRRCGSRVLPVSFFVRSDPCGTLRAAIGLTGSEAMGKWGKYFQVKLFTYCCLSIKESGAINRFFHSFTSFDILLFHWGARTFRKTRQRSNSPLKSSFLNLFWSKVSMALMKSERFIGMILTNSSSSPSYQTPILKVSITLLSTEGARNKQYTSLSGYICQ